MGRISPTCRVGSWAIGAFLAALTTVAALARPLETPFDFSHGAIGLDVTIKNVPLFALLDTGVDPSAIDLSRADALGLKVDRAAGGEASGAGDAASARVYPTTIEGLAIAGRPFGSVNALGGDLSAISTAYGRRIDAVLGYSFLSDKTVLVDYARRHVAFLDRPSEAAAVRGCRAHWRLPIQFLGDDNTPIIPNFRIGAASGPATLDTGSNGAVTLFPRGLDLPGVRAGLVESSEVTNVGARGSTKSAGFVTGAPVGFGPFSLPAGQKGWVGAPQSATDKRIANLGNPLFAAMNLKLLLDYRAKAITFYGDCRG